MIGVEDHLERVLPRQRGIAARVGGDDLRRVAVEQLYPDVECRPREDHAHLGALARGLPFGRLDLGEGVDDPGLCPRGIIEDAVYGRALGHLRRHGAMGVGLRGLPAGARLRSGHRGNGKKCQENRQSEGMRSRHGRRDFTIRRLARDRRIEAASSGVEHPVVPQTAALQRTLH